MPARIKRDDLVVVISGKDKGSEGRVTKVLADAGKVVVEGVNKVKRHKSPRKYREGGIEESEAPIFVSKVMLIDPTTKKPTRVKAGSNAEGKKIRVASKTGAALDS